MPNGNSPSGEAVQTPAPATGKWGLSWEAQAALLRVRTRPECPEGNLREQPKLQDSQREKKKERELSCEKPEPKTLPGLLTEQRTEQI